ncbi:ARF GTPase-activating protein GIT1 isoform X2 [Hydra vulgaris]|uniref:ARF GTPase-activating protein GIT1 isoform X2 n=1 Tax=Hydra vulgaris TaxID=6087 RepID=UPI001F5FDF4D|nr:ARF GTPase-activating protein GIT1 isoform X2 [Hydra vulgaris]
MSLTRVKVRTSSETCADCSAAGPEWASINRGVLICDECCSVHRSLGRHISQVRHLRLAPWNTSLFAMTQNLVSNGANLIWEHSLTDASKGVAIGIRKPNPNDNVHPIKSNFIKAKYQLLAFVHRLPNTDDKLSVVDLSKQLYSSVRTGNLETSLRLISLGAQTNYFHPEKGNTPLHVAAAAGQATQCELLVVHGADASALDINEKTPTVVAIENGHTELGFRLIETMYELTDRLTFYLCGRRPDHRNGINYLIPALQDRGIDASSSAKEARCKLQSLNNRLFEELCSDVYDEVDRRENDAVWLATQHHRKLVSDTAVPFLPVNPSFSSTRNQGRQKLARFNALEFATLIVDILHDAKRREGLNVDSNSQSAGIVEKLKPMVDPDYDEIMEDNKEATSDDASSLTTINDEAFIDTNRTLLTNSTELGCNPLINNEGAYDHRDYDDPQDCDSKSYKGKFQELEEQNHSLGQEVNLLRSMVQKLMQENASLRAQVAQLKFERDDFEQRVDPNKYDRTKTSSQKTEAHPNPSVQSYSINNREETTNDTKSPGYSDNRKLDAKDRNYNESEEDSADPYRSTEDDIDFQQEIGPSQEDIVNATEQITKKIQELLLAAQNGRSSRYVPCSSNISAAVNDMANLFPKHPSAESVRMALRLMITSAARLQVECRSSALPERNVDQAMLTQQVIQCAYDIAKAAKHLVTTFNSA